MRHLMKTAGLVGMSWLMATGFAQAERVVLRPEITTTQWRTAVPEAPIRELHVYVRKASGSDTFFNMRFGREGHTFDGRRVYLRNQGLIKASWNLQGRQPGGKELILNSYNGKVYVERIEVVFQDGWRRDDYGSPRGYDRRDGDRYDDRYDSRYDQRYDDRGRYDPGYPERDIYAQHPRDCGCSRHRSGIRYDTPPRYAPRVYDDHRDSRRR